MQTFVAAHHAGRWGRLDFYHSSRRRCRPRAAFTLIEVLVVVAIIALLVAVLIPSLKKARDNAKLTACKANLHDLGVATTSYSVEYKGWFPPSPYIGSIIWQGCDNPAADDNLFVLWYCKLAKNADIFTCPATNHKIRTPDRIEKVPTPLGINYVVHTDGSAGHVNDFERLGQYAGTDGHGTSYENMMWATREIFNRKEGVWEPNWSYVTDINSFWHVKKLGRNDRYLSGSGIYKTNWTRPHPAEKPIMKDADDSDQLAQWMGFDGITGSNGVAWNNFPEPWDNHGIVASNELYADGHVVTVKYAPAPGYYD